MRFFILFLILTVFSSCDWNSNTIAEVGSIKITKDEYKYLLTKRYGEKESYKDVPKTEKDAIIDQIIIRKLKLNLAYDKGLDKDEKIVLDYKNRKNQMIGNLYFEKVIIDKLFPESKVRKEFEMAKNEIKASHILISFKGARGGKSTRTKEEAFLLASDISERAREGKDGIDQLAIQYSDDPSAKNNQGDLGYFLWGKMVGAFQETAFELKKGEISNPVLTDFGYHVIQVSDIRLNPRFNENDYEKNKTGIKQRMFKAVQDTARKMWTAHSKKIKDEANFSLLVDNMNEVIASNKKYQENNELKLEGFSEEEKEVALVEWDGGVFNFKDLLDVYTPQFSRLKSHLVDFSLLVKDVDQIAGNEVIISVAEKMELIKNQDAEDQLSNFLEMKMVKILEKEEVRDKIIINDADLEQYYAGNRGEFVLPEKMEMWEIYVTDEQKANKLAISLKAGRKDFKQTVKKVSEDKALAKKGGYLGYKTLNGRANVSKEAFAAGENSVTGPIKYRKGWVIIKTGKKQPESLNSFESAKGQIKSKVRNKMTRSRREEWEKEMRESYAVTIKEDIIAEM